MPTFHPSIAHIPRPARIARLPVDHRGYPVPTFVAVVDGRPDHRLVNPQRIGPALTHRQCWICGEPLGRYLASLLGPMCTVTRTVSEPPSHQDCARYAALACPFLSRPHMGRREAGLPAEACPAAGLPLRRNPGVVAVWTAREVHPFLAPDGGVLFQVGDPTSVHWYAEGRMATRAEVLASFETGLPLLEATAREDGPAAVRALQQQTVRALRYLPR